MYASRSHLPWSQTENETLRSIIEKSTEKKTDWGLISLSLPGRNGHSIQQHYSEMTARGETEHAAIEITKVNPFGDMTKRMFLHCFEEILSSFIEGSFMDGIQMDFEYVKEKARDFYYTPYVIAERITYEIFSRTKKQIYASFTKSRYTEEFINECRERESRYEISTIAMLEEIEESGLPEPQFLDHWVRNFMKRNRLSVRQAHFRRCGIIDEREVSDFITAMFDAIKKYGWTIVFNMDEPSVMINNGSNKTIAPVGAEEIIIPGDKNEKECFTCIGSCFSSKKYDLIVLGVGTTDQCCRKFGTRAMGWPFLS